MLFRSSERIVGENLASDHYAGHLISRLSWAVADAEALESAPAAASAPRTTAPTESAPTLGASATRTPSLS